MSLLVYRPPALTLLFLSALPFRSSPGRHSSNNGRFQKDIFSRSLFTIPMMTLSPACLLPAEFLFASIFEISFFPDTLSVMQRPSFLFPSADMFFAVCARLPLLSHGLTFPLVSLKL